MPTLPFITWFSLGEIVGGDWRFFWPETLSKILDYSYVWDSSLNSGLGGVNLHLLSLNSYLSFGGFFLTQLLHIPWFIGEKLLYFWPILSLSFLSSFFLSRQVYKNTFVNIFTGILYIFNTYALAIFGGGQVGLALAYSIAPLVLGTFIKLISNLATIPLNFKFQISNFKLPIVVGLVLAINVFFDLRIAYIVVGAIFIYFLLRHSFKGIFFVFVIPSLIAVLLHAFWVLPTLIFKIDLGERFVVQDPLAQLRFFSFALFENSFSLLHPNWPENIFGKTYFMKSEFILLPIIAFSSLLFLYKSKVKSQESKVQVKSQNFNYLAIEQFSNRIIIFFALLGLLGAFLAKGTNEPFGDIYLWLYDLIPGFVMFRDPTKFYLLVALSYSVLVPFSVYSIYSWLKSKVIHSASSGLTLSGVERVKSQKSKVQFNIQNYLPNLFLICTILYFIFLIRPVFLGELGGTFKKHEIPNDYALLKDFLHNQPEFFRTLWIPQWQRFGYFSNNHPAVGKKELIGDITNTFWNDPSTEILLKNASIKYVIVPYDSEGEIFLNNRKYDENTYQQAVQELRKVSFLKEIKRFGKSIVFEAPNPKDHFFIELSHGPELNPREIKNQQSRIQYEVTNPTKYKVKISSAKKNDILVFSEGFDRNWVAKNSEFRVPASQRGGQSSKFGNMLNSFALPKDGDYSFEVYYEPQKWVNVGFVISGLAFVGCVFFLLKSYDKD